MFFPRSSAEAARLLVLEHAGSTNDELAGRLGVSSAADLPPFTVVASLDQTDGRGRLGRKWSAPPGTMLAASVLVRPGRDGIAVESVAWLPLLSGLAMTEALRSLGAGAELKWPNDVLIRGRKVCGILVEALSPDAVVIGSGVNLSIAPEDLPVPSATSLQIENTLVDADTVLAAYLKSLRARYEHFVSSGGDAVVSGLRARVAAVCSTIGRTVRVELPAGDALTGVAEELDDSGRLVVEASGRRTAVSAGDVTHLRY